MENNPAENRNSIPKHLKVAGKTVFFIFLIKGLLWLIIPAVLVIFAVEC